MSYAMIKASIIRLACVFAALYLLTTLWQWSNDRPLDDESLGSGIFLAVCTFLLYAFARLFQWGLARIAAACFCHFDFVRLASRIAGSRRVENELRRVALKLRNAGKSTAAIDVWSAVIQLDPSQAGYWVDRGVSLFEVGEFDAAISDLSHAIGLNPSVVHAHRHRGYAYFEKQEYQLAIRDFETPLCVESLDAELAFWQAIAYEQVCQWQPAVKHYETTLQLDDSCKYAQSMLARLLACCPDESIRDGQRALELAQTACAMDNANDWESLSIVAAAHAELGDFENALHFARQVADAAHDDEKATRLERIKQFEQNIPYRLPEAVSK